MDNEKYTFNKFISETAPTFLLGAISMLLLLVAMYGCSQPLEPTIIKKVVVVDVKQYREPNSLQDYEVKWKVTLSDGHKTTMLKKPNIGDTITYRYYSIKK